jgi:sugar/nucleoside kinase (ribokinase family)
MIADTDIDAAPFDIFISGRPSVDVMFSHLVEWPALGKDVDAGGLGVCAGTSFNTPAAANRLGMRVAYAAAIGSDVWSGLVREEFRTEGLPTQFLHVVDRPLPFISVALNFDDDRGFVTHYGPDERDDAELATHAIDVVKTIDARHAHGYAGEEPSEIVTTARERGMTVSLDAWGGPWWKHHAPLEEVVGNADVVLANEPEALAMTREDDVVRAGRRLADLGPCAVIKRGPRGAIGVTEHGVHEVPAVPARVLDATGAGDCFNAGFLFGWLGGLRLRESLTLGTICGARAVEAFGGYRGCPSQDQLRGAASAHGIELPPHEDGRP